MKINSINKKLVSNLILGSSLYGISAGIITQVQATSTPPNQEQDVHKHNQEATEQLRALRSQLAPVEEWIKLIDRENGADPNGEVGVLVPLEEAILHRDWKAVEILIQRGADLNRSVAEKEVTTTDCNKDENGKTIFRDRTEHYGRKLLHLAVYDPDEMKKVWESHVSSLGINQVKAKQLYASVKIVELLIKNMDDKRKIIARKNNEVMLTAPKMARSNCRKISDKIEKGEYDAKEYTPILKEYEAVADLLKRHAPPEGSGSIPSGYNGTSITLSR